MTRFRAAHCFMGLIVLLTVAALEIPGALTPLDRASIDWRFRLLERPASGSLVIVQIDSRSLGELDRWPWPRRHHAEVLDRLIAAGASEIAWDVDFSARGTAEDDRTFAEALARAGDRVILAAFRQTASPEAVGGEIFDTLPKPMFGEHVQIGSVNVTPGSDGLVRSMSDTETIAGRALPAVFALLAGPESITGRAFRIDFGIDPRTVPRLSYVDVLRGDFDPASVAGRKVIVGATATELRDILPVPIYRSISGSALQALAYESVVQGRALRSPGMVVDLAVAALAVLLLWPLFSGRSWSRAIPVALLAAVGLELTAMALQAAFPVALSTAPAQSAILLFLLAALVHRLQAQARRILVQRRALARRRALLDRVVEDSFDGIVITDEEGRIQVSNQAAQSLLGWARDEMAGRPLEDVAPGLAEALSEGIGAVEPMGSALPPRDCVISHRDGRPLDIELVPGRVHLDAEGGDPGGDGPPRLFHSYTFRDISERRRARRAEKEAMERAVVADRAKTEFLANMSHELRTPLNAIIGFADIIRSETFGAVRPERYLDYVEDISSSGQHLLSILNDILDVSRIELGEFRLHKEQLDLPEVLRSCAALASGWPAFQKRVFRCDLPDSLPPIEGDERVVKQVVLNLLSNAFKYSAPGDEVHLRAAPDGTDSVIIAVRDTGIGIPREHLPRLTRSFYQVDGALDRRYEGTGLGLYLASSYVALHDGSLEIDSAPGAGTTVTVRLPCRRAAPETAATEPAPIAESA